MDVEMQTAHRRGLRRRVLLYWARLYAGQLQTGAEYTRLMPVIGVFILAFKELPTERLHSVFEVRERHEGYALLDALQLHFLELPNFRPPGASGRGGATLVSVPSGPNGRGAGAGRHVPPRP